MMDQRQRFALRKYSVGLASVLVGLLFMGGTAVHAADGQSQATAAVSSTTPATSTDATKTAAGKTTTADQPTRTPSPEKTTADNTNSSKTGSDPVTAPTKHDGSAMQSNQQPTVNPATVTTNLAATQAPAANQYNVDDWQYTTASDGITLTNYTGQGTDFYIPNAKSFRDAGKITAGQKVFLTYDFLRQLVNEKKATSISIERAADANDKVVAVGYYDSNNAGNKFNLAFGPHVSDHSGDDQGTHGNQTLKHIDVAGLDVSQLTDMSGLFMNDKALESITGLDAWTFSPHMHSIGHMFAWDDNLKTIQGIDKWDTTNFQYIDNLVIGDKNLTNLDLSGWKTDQVILANDMFNEATSLTTVGDLSNWRLNNAVTTANMFNDTGKIQNLGNLDNWGLAKDTDMSQMFRGMDSLKHLGDLSKWQTGNVTTMEGMFRFDGALQSVGHLDNWQVGKVTNMKSMFDFAHSIVDLGNLDNWDTSNVEYMGQMFREDVDSRQNNGATGKTVSIGSLKHVGNLSRWNTAKVKDMAGMFQGTQLTSVGDLSNWQTGQVGTANPNADGGYNAGFDYMFQNTPDLTSIGDIHNWDVHNVTQMFNMFDRSGIKNINISGWHFNDKMTTADRGGVGTTNMFANLKNPTTIIANDLVNTPSTFTAKDFAGNQPLIVISNDATLQKMNTQSDGHNGTGHPADTIHYVQLQDDQPQPVGSQQQDFVYANQDALNKQLTKLTTGTNFKAVTNNPSSKIPDGDVITPEGTTDLEKIAGNYDVGETVHRTYKVIEKLPDGHGGITQKTILQFDGDFYRPLIKNADGTYKYGQFQEGPNASYVTGTWANHHQYSADDHTAGETTYDTVSGYTAHLPKGPQGEDVIQKINRGQWVRMDGPIWFKNWYKRDHASVPADDNHLTMDIFQGDEGYDEMPKSQDFDITYTTNVYYQLVDDDKNEENVGAPVTISGESGQTVDPSKTVKVPEHYVLADGKSIPTTYTFKQPNQTVKIHLKHDTQDATTAEKKDPVTSTFHIIEKLPDGTKKTIWTLTTTQYRQATKDLVTGKITYGKYTDVSGQGEDPHNTYEMSGQALHLGSHGLPNDTTAGTGSYDPAPDGYTINLHMDKLPAATTPLHISYDQTNHTYYVDVYWGKQPVDEFPKNQDFYIDYTAKSAHQDYQFVDDAGHVIKPDGTTNADPNAISTSVNGQTDGIITTPKVPAGWVTTDGQPVPGGKFQPDDKEKTIQVPVVHKIITVHPDKVTANQPLKGNENKIPGDGKPKNDITYSDLHKTITRMITITKPGETTPQKIKQTVTLTRSVTIDDVTGDVKPGAWSTGSFLAFNNVPTVPGYTASRTRVDGEQVTADTTNQTVKITYTANDTHQDYRFVNGDGKVIKMDGTTNPDPHSTSTTVNGKVGDQINTPSVPNGWVTIPGTTVPGGTFGPDSDKTPITVLVQHGSVTIKPSELTKPVQQIAGDHAHPGDNKPNRAISYADLHHTVTRTITVEKPDGTTATEIQKVSFSRPAHIDTVTGAVTLSDNEWTPDAETSFVVYTPDPVDGYTPQTVAAKPVKVTDPDTTATVGYTANTAHQDYQFVDGDGNVVKPDGTTTSDKHTISTSVNGHTGENITTPKVPAGWVTTDGQPVPGGKFQPNDKEQTMPVSVKHGIKPVTPADVVTPGAKIAGNSDKQPGDGKPIKDITYSDLHKTIARTITITKPGEQPQTTTQKINYQRPATIDDVTGDVDYGNWTVASDSPAQTLKAVNAPDVPGYTKRVSGSVGNWMPSQDDINHWTDSQSTVTYIADPATIHVHFQTGDGTTVPEQQISGRTGEPTTGKRIQIPAGWAVDGPEPKLPETFAPDGSNSNNVMVPIKHATTTIQPTAPKSTEDILPNNPDKTYPAGVGAADLNKTVTRTIRIMLPDGTVVTETQTTHLTRTATVDELTGHVTYGQWSTGHWDAYDVPAVPGYTPSQRKIAGMDVTADAAAATVNITYAAANRQAQTAGHETVNSVGVATQSDNQKSASQRQLPQTGNDHSDMTVLGLGLLSMLELFGFRKKQD